MLWACYSAQLLNIYINKHWANEQKNMLRAKINAQTKANQRLGTQLMYVTTCAVIVRLYHFFIILFSNSDANMFELFDVSWISIQWIKLLKCTIFFVDFTILSVCLYPQFHKTPSSKNCNSTLLQWEISEKHLLQG